MRPDYIRRRPVVILLAASLFLFLSNALSIAQTNRAEKVLKAQGDEVHIENLVDLNTAADEATPFISARDGAIYFTSSRDGKNVLYVAPRIASSDPKDHSSHWGTPKKFAELPEKQNLSSLSVSGDGVSAVVGICNRPDGILQTCDIYQTQFLPNGLSDFTPLGSDINSEWWDGQPSISSDGQMLFFASDRKGGHGGTDIYMCTRGSDGKWSKPVDLSFNSDGNDLSPFIAKDNQTLYFSSNGLPGGLGGYDIYMSQRVGQNEWTAPKNLGNIINSSANEMFFFVPPNEDAVYFASDREGGKGWYDLYRVYVQAAPPKPKFATITGRVLDAETGAPIGTTPEISITEGAENTPVTNDGTGKEYSVRVKASSLIHVSVSADAYVSNSVEVQAPAEPGSMTTDIRLTPAHARISGAVTNAFSHSPVAADVVLEEDDNPAAKMTTTANASTGAYSFNVNALKSYRITATAKDYQDFHSKVEIPTTREKTVIDVTKDIHLTPAAIQAVMIFFDFDKSDVRPQELSKFDKFIEQVKENSYVRIEVNGHTDDVGTADYNEKLSERRAVAVEDYLLSRGVPRDQLAIVKGWGASAPLVAGTSDEARAKNRRVEVRIVGKED